MSIKPSAAACALVAALSLTACGGDGEPDVTVTSGTVISNVTVVDTRTGGLRANMAVVIEGATIKTIAPNDRVRVQGSAQVIDATGKFVVPGLLDMHTHLFDTSAEQQTPTARLLVANGITGIREMRGSAALVASAKQLNADSAAGTVVAPEVLTIPGEIIGNSPLLAAASTTAAGAVAETQKQKAYGAGFIKVTNANREATLAVLAEAKAQGLYVAGHLSPALSAIESANAGWKVVEHQGSGIGTLLDCSTDEAAVRSTLLTGAGGVTPGLPPTWPGNAANAPLFQRVQATYDAAKCRTVAQAFARNDTWHVPTLIRLRTQRFVDDAAYRNDPNLVYVGRATRAAWEAAALARLALPASVNTTYHQYSAFEQPLTKLLKGNGVKLMAGSDTSTQAPWVIPGFSLHQEFALLAEAGLSPLEILQMTTLNGAQFLGRESTMGTVDEGKNADLVLLDADPTASAANLGRIWAVLLKGRYFSTAALAALKADVARSFANQAFDAKAAAAIHVHAD